MNKKILSFALVGLLSGSFATTECGFIKKAAVITSVAALGAALYRLNAKKALSEPISRFENDKLKAAFASKDKTEILNQIWFFIDDIIIGQLYKKDGIKADKEGKIEVSKGTPSTGLFGTIQSKIFPITTAITSVIAINEFFKLLGKSYEDFTDYVSSDC